MKGSVTTTPGPSLAKAVRDAGDRFFELPFLLNFAKFLSTPATASLPEGPPCLELPDLSETTSLQSTI
ncbi:hypothetical protein Dthio_PD2904 [Desulfonatronospira thiodismutans ASO3-1]|uniref:Uncharacterized protein n=1 Tax=Desulfonatronospira thiodismutans ASO3-1 TaxID=555779 RepID=D6SLC1_9BACT|nr:hypothetical protein Dthio_PD2904 [Desulfonatronospira thiodismutans ASO3-1]